MNIHIIGAKGYVGSVLFSFFKMNSKNNIKGIHRKIEQQEMDKDLVCIPDYLSYKSFTKKSIPDVIIISIGSSDVDFSEKNRRKSLIYNVIEPLKYIKSAIEANSKVRIVLISTIYVYGISSNQMGYTESSIVNPTSVYGQHKVLLEKKLQVLTKNYNIVRLPFVVGNFSKENDFFNLIEKTIIKEKKELNLDTGLRFPTNVFGIAFYIFKIVEGMFIDKIFHIPCKEAVSKYEMARIFLIELGNTNIINNINERKEGIGWLRPKFLKLSSEKEFIFDERIFDWRLTLPLFKNKKFIKENLDLYCYTFYRKFNN